MPGFRLAAVATVLLVVFAGCSGGPGGDKPPIQASAHPADLSDGAVAEAGLEPVEERTVDLNTTVFVSIQGDVELSTSREVNAVTHTRVYRGESAAGPVVVAVYAVPAVTLLEDTAPTVRNPAGEWSAATLTGTVQSVYEVEAMESEPDGTATLLGNQTTLQTLMGSASAGGKSVAIGGTMASVRHDGDYVTVVVLAPADGSGPAVEPLLDGVSHPEK